jgi:hypothetical protein
MERERLINLKDFFTCFDDDPDSRMWKLQNQTQKWLKQIRKKIGSSALLSCLSFNFAEQKIEIWGLFESYVKMKNDFEPIQKLYFSLRSL